MFEKININGIRIVQAFLSDYSRGIHLREIARVTSLNVQTCHKETESLVNLNILRYEMNGRNKDFFLNRDNFLARQMIVLAESFRAFSFVQDSRLAVILKEISSHYPNFCVFGSFAEGKQSESSDLDIVIFDADNKAEFDFSIEMNAKYIAYDEFSVLLGKGNTLAKEIAKKHIVFGDISRFVTMLLRWYDGKA